MVDYNIILKCIDKKAEGYKKLYDVTVSYVLSIVRSYVYDATIHKDMVQECYAKIFCAIDKYDVNKGEFKPWLRKVVVNECLMHLRSRKLIKFTELDVDNDAYLLPLNQDLTGFDKEAIYMMLDHMPIGFKTIFLMVAIDEFSHSEVAKTLHISEETSRSQYFRARKWIIKNILETDKIKQYGFF